MADDNNEVKIAIHPTTHPSRCGPNKGNKAEVWAALSSTQQKDLGHAQLRPMVAAELADPDQIEFTIDGEPYPIEEVEPELLLRRGYRLIAAGKKFIERGEAYVAEAKSRINRQELGL